MVNRKEIDTTEELSRFAELRITGIHTRSSTAISTIISYLAIIIVAYFSALEAARAVDNLWFGTGIAVSLIPVMLYVVRYARRHIKAISSDELIRIQKVHGSEETAV